MVRIINGEIVQDNDPRVLEQKRREAAQRDASSSSGSSRVTTMHQRHPLSSSSSSASQGSTNTLGIPGFNSSTLSQNVNIMGYNFQLLHIIIAGLAVLLGGWRALAAIVILAIVFRSAPPQTQNAPNTSTHNPSSTGSSSGGNAPR
eukprot:GILJ01008530.1.p1 GENE.GILJ01008530.1~~GILJ01008530.1.p1  ORF type:complete len:146 (+),score=21.53 GILJ01008530.1:39-476(+)